MDETAEECWLRVNRLWSSMKGWKSCMTCVDIDSSSKTQSRSHHVHSGRETWSERFKITANRKPSHRWSLCDQRKRGRIRITKTEIVWLISEKGVNQAIFLFGLSFLDRRDTLNLPRKLIWNHTSVRFYHLGKNAGSYLAYTRVDDETCVAARSQRFSVRGFVLRTFLFYRK